MTKRPNAANKQRNRDNAKEEIPNMLQRIWTFLFVGKAGMWTAIFTGVLTLFTYLVWDVYEAINQTTQSSERAFITNTGMAPFMTKVLDAQGKQISGYNLSTSWANSGTTPSKIVTYEANLAIVSNSPESTDFDNLSQSEKYYVVFGPKQILQIPQYFISLTDLESVEAGKSHVFLWGWATYHDIFLNTPTRLTEYCIEILTPKWTKPDRADPTGDVNIQSPPCKTHNCYDEECADYKKRSQ
jgi:hypothetical protein